MSENYAIYNDDCINVISQLPDNSVDFCIYSPPFADLYVYSDSNQDMGNSKNYKEFFKHYDYLVSQLYRVMKPGRNISIHCMDIPAMKERDGYIGVKDFSGDMIKAHEKHNFIYHSRVTIWKDPLIENIRTRALGLAYKQIQKDSSMCRQGLPDYVITMRKEGENQDYIDNINGLGKYQGKPEFEPTTTGLKYNHEVWQRYASPVWMDIRQTYTLSKQVNDEKQEKHICPLQLDTIHRCIILWSRKGETVLSPFMGIGSEGYKAIELDRKFIGIELKKAYYDQAILNIQKAENKNKESHKTLFD